MITELLCVPLLFTTLCSTEVALSEETITLPTYETKSPDSIPLFFKHDEVQLAEQHIYPYPFYDVEGKDKVNRQYKALVLENEYLKICIMPEMGGRLYYALDKTNNYEIVYNNRVVKPALIGTIGAWTSGGVEWNTPHHHRPTSLIEVDYTTEEHADGSKTVWVGEYEKRSRTRWLTGLTLEPGKAYVKIDFKSINVTPFQYPALYFANVAIHVNDDYQFIFPPDVEMMNFHYVTEFTRWPILNQVYQSYDYTHGEDLSWWNVTKQPTSFFVTKTHQDFMGGIDHGKQAGIALIGDHRIFKGKKLWNWGKNEVQEVWDQKLTDEDGPYAELMMGFYSDNQPDYNFVAPFETKYGTMYLYGLRTMSGIKEASKDFALNLDIKDNKALIQVNATSKQQGITILLTDQKKNILEIQTDLSPATPCVQSVPVRENVLLEDLKLTVLSSNDNELISWQKQPPLNEPFPEVYRDPLDPREYKTSQELYYAGLKLEQFGNTNFDYMKYYEAALQLNPDDVPTNTRLGMIYLKRMDYPSAEAHLKKVVDIVTGNHKKAEDAASLYYLGVCYMKQDRIEEALDLLYRATWAYEWTSAGYTLAAQLEGRKGNWKKALDAADRACNANTQNVEALVTKAMVLRQLGDYEEALRLAKQALDVDPLCFIAMNELLLLGTHLPVNYSKEAFLKQLRTEPYNYIETAVRYSDIGLFADAVDVMTLAATSPHKALNAYPMVHYHLGIYLALAGEEQAAEDDLRKAAGLSTELCFPYCDESVKALRFALSRNPDDAAAAYLLGNALADYQHEEAVHCWELAAQHTPDASIIYRNIAYIQANHLRDMPDALDNIMHAISLDPTEPRYFSEADLYMSYASLTADELAAFLAEYGDMGKDIIDIQLMQVKLDIYNKHYDKAISLLTNMQYHIKEGATFNPHVYWFDAHLQRGRQLMQEGDYTDAEAYFRKAMEFPANLEAERNSKIGIAWYYLGLNSKLAGNNVKAKEYFTNMVDYTHSTGWGAGDFPELSFFKALAALELSKDEAEANAMFQQLITDGENRLNPVKDGRHITTTVEEEHTGRLFRLEHELSRKNLRVSSYYMQGLGHLGLGDKEKARIFFNKAVEADPISIDPKLMLEELE
jgi:tetratricopeptide (TPR) repeat protein